MNKYNNILNVAKEMKASPLSLFRVDKRKFEVGNIIRPNGEYYTHLDAVRRKVEDSLSRTNSNIERNNILFLFDDIKNALIFWRKIGESANIYEVKLTGEQVLHKADMNYLDVLSLIERELKDDKKLDCFSEKYWGNESGLFSPCYELLVREAKVKKIIVEGSSEQAKELLNDIKKNTYIQNTDFYKDFYSQQKKASRYYNDKGKQKQCN